MTNNKPGYFSTERDNNSDRKSNDLKNGQLIIRVDINLSFNKYTPDFTSYRLQLNHSVKSATKQPHYFNFLRARLQNTTTNRCLISPYKIILIIIRLYS